MLYYGSCLYKESEMSDNVVSLTLNRQSSSTAPAPGLGGPSSSSKYYRLQDEKLTYTEAGLKLFRPMFARAGINIHDIKTLDSHLRAEDACEGFLVDYMMEHAPKSESLGLRMFGQILNGNSEEASRLDAILKRKQHFKIV